jgi:hypothetical protein
MNETGKVTCRNANIVNYCISSSEILKYFSNFTVLDFCKLFSDVHCPLKVYGYIYIFILINHRFYLDLIFFFKSKHFSFSHFLIFPVLWKLFIVWFSDSCLLIVKLPVLPVSDTFKGQWTSENSLQKSRTVKLLKYLRISELLIQ